MAGTTKGGLNGLVVLAFESRRADEIAELIRRRGGRPVVAPALRELPLEHQHHALAFLDQIERGAIDVVILLTGTGTRALVSAVEPRCSRERFTELLRRSKLVVRGPKPAAVLRELGLSPTVVVPEPNTWREVLTALDRELPVAGLRVAVQEYGQSNPQLIDGLRARGADTVPVPVYRWALPDDLAPLRAAIAALLDGRVDVALFTSATQVHHLFHVAQRDGGDVARLRRAFAQVLIASIGPVCSEALREHALQVDLEPEHFKMGHLIAALARYGPERLRTKRGSPA